MTGRPWGRLGRSEEGLNRPRLLLVSNTGPAPTQVPVVKMLPTRLREVPDRHGSRLRRGAAPWGNTYLQRCQRLRAPGFRTRWQLHGTSGATRDRLDALCLGGPRQRGQDCARYLPLGIREASFRPAGWEPGSDVGKRLKTGRGQGPFLGDARITQAQGPFQARPCGSRDSTSSRQGPFPPADVLAPLGRGCKATRAGCTQKQPLPCPPLGPSPGPRLGRVRPSLRDRLSPRPETPRGSGRRSTRPESRAPVAAAASLTILSLGSAQSPEPPPPPSSSDSSAARPPHAQPMRDEANRAVPYGGPHKPFPAPKRSCSRGSRGGGGEESNLEASKSVGNIRALETVALRRASPSGLLGPVAMLKCGMNGGQVKGGACLPLLWRKGKGKVRGGASTDVLLRPLRLYMAGLRTQSPATASTPRPGCC